MIPINNIHQGKLNSHLDPTTKCSKLWLYSSKLPKFSMETFHCRSGRAHCTAILDFFKLAFVLLLESRKLSNKQLKNSMHDCR